MQQNQGSAVKLKIFIIAGEPSGDVLGGKLMSALKNQNLQIEFSGIGGNNMEKQGLKSIFPLSELSLMGFAEVIPHIPRLLKMIKSTAQNIIDSKPDIVITIDAPDFCFRVIKKLNQNNISHQIKKVHLIAPSVWAYRPGRAKKIAQLYDLLLAILPFEPPYFEKHGLKTVFIGHPIMENNMKPNFNFREKYGINSDEILLCLTPGSRTSEVNKILPEMIKAANILFKNHQNLTVIIPALNKTYELIKSHLINFEPKVILISEEEKLAAFYGSDFAIAKSGTNTLELSIAKLPMVVTYKINFLTYLIVKTLVKIKFANLINLILNKEVIPEMLQKNCQGEKLALEIEKLILDKNLSQKQTTDSEIALKILGLNSDEKPSKKAAKAILS